MNTTRRLEKNGLTPLNIAGRALVALAFSAACLTLPIAPAFAGGFKVDPPSVTVYYDPVKVEQWSYAEDLHARLQDAASQVCGEVDIREGRNQGDVNRCFGKSLNRAIREVGSPTLAEVHGQGRQGVVRIARR
jgi:UrcA family protein